MEITLLAVGRLRPALREACDDYTRRISRHARFTEIEVREAARAPSPALQREQEAVRLRARLPAGAVVVALAREGQGWTSEALAARLRDWQVAARPLAFMIGGSHGLDASLLGTAAERWSLGPATLPHELARVVVAEQIYRAFTILRGEPYHKGAPGGKPHPRG
ncbi:MAG TPA: 23S rRNA (pseudouridine(1915)-N(3))-methyltransferase RlmH [Gemmatimonadales bacterium]|nr:23S rRNA (pseudouridine(1915)-N(3))-methyltransferase RlmH [Gemmatimonadales bacterium]